MAKSSEFERVFLMSHEQVVRLYSHSDGGTEKDLQLRQCYANDAVGLCVVLVSSVADAGFSASAESVTLRVFASEQELSDAQHLLTADGAINPEMCAVRFRHTRHEHSGLPDVFVLELKETVGGETVEHEFAVTSAMFDEAWRRCSLKLCKLRSYVPWVDPQTGIRHILHLDQIRSAEVADVKGDSGLRLRRLELEGGDPESLKAIAAPAYFGVEITGVPGQSNMTYAKMIRDGVFDDHIRDCVQPLFE